MGGGVPAKCGTAMRSWATAVGGWDEVIDDGHKASGRNGGDHTRVGVLGAGLLGPAVADAAPRVEARIVTTKPMSELRTDVWVDSPSMKQRIKSAC